MLIGSGRAGGSPFCVMDESRSRGLLGYAPRPMLDMALTRPEAYLGGEPLALSAEQQDTSIAYQLLTEVDRPPHPLPVKMVLDFVVLTVADQITQLLRLKQTPWPRHSKAQCLLSGASMQHITGQTVKWIS